MLLLEGCGRCKSRDYASRSAIWRIMTLDLLCSDQLRWSEKRKEQHGADVRCAGTLVMGGPGSAV